MSPKYYEIAVVFCTGCPRKVEMNPEWVRKNGKRMRCTRCGRKGPHVKFIHTAEKPPGNVVPLRRRK